MDEALRIELLQRRIVVADREAGGAIGAAQLGAILDCLARLDTARLVLGAMRIGEDGVVRMATGANQHEHHREHLLDHDISA